LALLGGCFAAAGLAQLTMQLVPPTASGPVLGGVYISPYTALINGTPTLVICDDFETDVSLNTPPWTAYATTVSSLQGEVTPNNTLKYDNSPMATAATQQSQYTVAAYLATQILHEQSLGHTTAQGDLSFALWGLFDTSLSGPLSGGWVTGQDLTNAITDLSNAETYVSTHNLTPSNFANVTVYSPSPKSASQEYIVVTPEPSGMAILVVELSGLLAVVYAFRRRAAQSAR